MINFNKKDAVADSIARILQQEESECVTKPEAKNIAKKEVKGHEKSMHHKEEIDVNDRTEDMIGGYGQLYIQRDQCFIIQGPRRCTLE